MQRRSLRGRVYERKALDSSVLSTLSQEEKEQDVVPEPEAEPPTLIPMDVPASDVVEAPPQPVKRRPGRPRRSEMKPVEVKARPPSVAAEPGEVVLNARGMPMRQRKRNRYYEEDEEETSTSPILKIKPDKKIKMEPLQILLDNPANSLKVTPIMSEAIEIDNEVEISVPVAQQQPLVQAKKSVVKIVMPPTNTTNTTKSIDESTATLALAGTTIYPVVFPQQASEPKITAPKVGIHRVYPMKGCGFKSDTIRSESFGRKDSSRSDGNRRSDYSSFIRFFANVKTKVILPDRWGINGVMFDSVRKMKTFTMCELEITSTGEPGVRKCIQVFEDLSLLVSVQGQDLTSRITGLKRLQSEHDVPDVVSKINALKVCTGVKTFNPSDLNYHPTVQKKGTCYFSAECQVILAVNYVGALCPPCNKLRNAIRRRKTKLKQDREKVAAKLNVKSLPSVFGRALYGVLNQMMTEHKPKRTGTNSKGNLSEVKHEVPGASGTGGRRRCGNSIKLPRRPRASEKQRKSRASGGIGAPVAFSHLLDSGNVTQTVLPHGLVDYLTLSGETGNIVIQNGGEFNFADGQEYELIGEADSVEPLQLLDPQEEQTIQIIEVDDQTMAQLAAQNINMSGMFFSDPSNIQVTEIDPNDPNTLFKVIHPGEIFLQDRKL